MIDSLHLAIIKRVKVFLYLNNPELKVGIIKEVILSFYVFIHRDMNK